MKKYRVVAFRREPGTNKTLGPAFWMRDFHTGTTQAELSGYYTNYTTMGWPMA